MPTASRNQRSCATRTTAASSDCRCASSHSSEAMSRWFVGSSSSSRSGSPASARASDARVSSPPENVDELPVEVRVAEAEPVQGRVDALAPGVAAGVLQPRLLARVRVHHGEVALGHLLLELAEPRLEREQVAAAAEHVVAQGEVAVARRALVVELDAGVLGEARAGRRRSTSPRTSIRSSVVLPEPLRPDSVSRSRRSSLKETPRSRGVPAMSLARSDAIATDTSALMVLLSRCAGPPRSSCSPPRWWR